jgi:hypothetical protein
MASVFSIIFIKSSEDKGLGFVFGGFLHSLIIDRRLGRKASSTMDGWVGRATDSGRPFRMVRGEVVHPTEPKAKTRVRRIMYAV